VNNTYTPDSSFVWSFFLNPLLELPYTHVVCRFTRWWSVTSSSYLCQQIYQLCCYTGYTSIANVPRER